MIPRISVFQTGNMIHYPLFKYYVMYRWHVLYFCYVLMVIWKGGMLWLYEMGNGVAMWNIIAAVWNGEYWPYQGYMECGIVQLCEVGNIMAMWNIMEICKEEYHGYQKWIISFLCVWNGNYNGYMKYNDYMKRGISWLYWMWLLEMGMFLTSHICFSKCAFHLILSAPAI